MSLESYFDVSAKTVKEQEKFLTTGCLKLDEILRGGIPCRGITQIYGAAGTGKTQLALQLCLTVQLPVKEGGLAAGAAYICTECAFPTRRLQELLQKSDIAKKHHVNSDKIFVEHISTIDELESCLLHRLPLLMAIHKIGLIVIDSIAAPYRVEDWNEPNNRAKSLRVIGQQLHKLCKNDDMCVICINQVAAIMDSNSFVYNNREEQPVLGNTWLSMITNSIYFYRQGFLRYALVTLSSCLPETTVPFTIHGYGVKAVDNE